MKLWKYEMLNNRGWMNLLTLAVLDMQDEPLQNKIVECLNYKVKVIWK
jgi:hypothetical protein